MSEAFTVIQTIALTALALASIASILRTPLLTLDEHLAAALERSAHPLVTLRTCEFCGEQGHATNDCPNYTHNTYGCGWDDGFNYKDPTDDGHYDRDDDYVGDDIDPDDIPF